MNDRFLFRGKCRQSNIWIYGGVEVQGERYCAIYDKELPYDNQVNVLYETIGQCTELHDKNDNLIFDGDIIKAEIYFNENNGEFIVYKIIHQDYSWKANKLYQIGIDADYELECIWFSELINKDWFGNIEIIGNIHDNPELLK